MLAAVVSHWGGVDILVNNAAIFDLAPIVEVTEASFDKVFAVNVKGLFFTLQAVAQHMIARGSGGKIINMASQAGRRGEALKYEGRQPGEKKKLVGEAVPFGRMGAPEDHTGAAVFLASPDADYIVAQTLNVDGGNWMS